MDCSGRPDPYFLTQRNGAATQRNCSASTSATSCARLGRPECLGARYSSDVVQSHGHEAAREDHDLFWPDRLPDLQTDLQRCFELEYLSLAPDTFADAPSTRLSST